MANDPRQTPANMSEYEFEAQTTEWLACNNSPAYFLDRYGWLYDATARLPNGGHRGRVAWRPTRPPYFSRYSGP
jgi:hypothetical protein